VCGNLPHVPYIASKIPSFRNAGPLAAMPRPISTQKNMPKITDINKGDVLSFQTDDGKYKALLCTNTNKVESPQYFIFAALTVNETTLPSLEDVINFSFYGSINKVNDYFKYTDSQLNKMWTIHPEIIPHCLGSYGLIIWRKDFMKFRDKFEYIGNINIVDNLENNGNGSMNASDWTFLKEFFNEKYKSILLARGQKEYSIMSIVNQ
jgi:hypothetical protein